MLVPWTWWRVDLLIQRYEETLDGYIRKLHGDMELCCLYRFCSWDVVFVASKLYPAPRWLWYLRFLYLPIVYTYNYIYIYIHINRLYVCCQWCPWKRKMPVISQVEHCRAATSSQKATTFFLLFPHISRISQLPADFPKLPLWCAVRNTLRISFPNCETDPRCSIQVPIG